MFRKTTDYCRFIYLGQCWDYNCLNPLLYIENGQSAINRQALSTNTNSCSCSVCSPRHNYWIKKLKQQTFKVVFNFVRAIMLVLHRSSKLIQVCSLDSNYKTIIFPLSVNLNASRPGKLICVMIFVVYLFTM